MKRTVRTSLAWILLLSTLLVYTPHANVKALAQGSPSGGHERAIQLLSQYMVGGSDLAGRLLRTYDYVPPVAAAEWLRYPSIRKIEIAYRAAEAAAPNKGGEKLLALLSQDLARRYESVREDKVLKNFLSPDPPEPNISFVNPPSPTDLRVSLPPKVTKAVESIASYCSRGPLGPPHMVIKEYFGVSESRAYEMLLRNKSHADAFKEALDTVPEQERIPKLRELSKAVAVHYEAVRYEKPLLALGLVEPPPDRAWPFPPTGGFNPPPDRPRPPDATPPSGGGSRAESPVTRPPSGGGGGAARPGAGGATEPTVGGGTRPRTPGAGPAPEVRRVSPTPGTSTSARRYNEFVRRNYSTPQSRGFSRMATSVGGFGGVVFGNDVTGQTGTSRPLSLSFVEGQGSGLGAIRVRFADGSTADFPEVRLDDVSAAHKIVFSGAGGMLPLREGDGVGLVGVDDHVDVIQCSQSDFKLKGGTMFNVTMHPAIENTDLGWAAVRVDTAPVDAPALVGGLEERMKLAQRNKILTEQQRKAAVDAVTHLFSMLESEDHIDLGTWKVVDVPMTVRRDGGLISVERTRVPNADFPDGLRQTAFIEMRNMTLTEEQALAVLMGAEVEEVGNEYDLEFADEFYRLVPVLAKSSYDYERLNSFAPVLALLRWAKANGAGFVPAQAAPPVVPTPEAIRLQGNSVSAIPRFELLNAYRDALRAATACQEEVEKSPALEKLLRESRSLVAELDTQLRLSAAAAPGSDEQKRALEAYRSAQTKLKELLAAEKSPEFNYWLELSEIISETQADIRRESSRAVRTNSPPATRAPRRRTP